LGKYEEPFGSSLFFREKPSEPEPSTSTNSSRPKKTGLNKLTSDLTPPPDPVFGKHLEPPTEFQLVANVHKVLKMTRNNLIRRDIDENVLKAAAEAATSAHNPKPFGVSYEEATNHSYQPKRTPDMSEEGLRRRLVYYSKAGEVRNAPEPEPGTAADPLAVSSTEEESDIEMVTDLESDSDEQNSDTTNLETSASARVTGAPEEEELVVPDLTDTDTKLSESTC
jgi:hypothetical protein